MEIKEDRGVKFHYISTTENPTNIASYGASAREIQNNRLWAWTGLDDKASLASLEMRGYCKTIRSGKIRH